jgi:hypothetical protein
MSGIKYTMSYVTYTCQERATMRPEQKRAWADVVVFAVAVAAVLALIPVAGFRAWGAIGIFGFACLTPLLFRTKVEPGHVASDERDQMILLMAQLGGFRISHIWFVLGSMVVWFYCMLQGKKAFSIEAFPFLVIVGTAIHYVVRAMATLLLYREHGADGQD